MPFDPAAWNAGGDDSRPASGVYDAVVIDTEVIERQADGEPFVKLTYRATSGPSTGVEWDQVKPAKGRGVFYTNAILQPLGYDVDRPVASLEEFEDRLAALRGVQAVVRVDSSGQYDDTEVIRRVEADDAPASSYGVPPSDVPAPGPDEFVHPPEPEAFDPTSGGFTPPASSRPEKADAEAAANVATAEAERPPQKGDIDPETGEPLPY